MVLHGDAEGNAAGLREDYSVGARNAGAAFSLTEARHFKYLILLFISFEKSGSVCVEN
jgi:hypothetical protein